MFMRCACCHRLVLRWLYARHREKHTARLPDGQMTNHITVHPRGRFKGTLEGVPRVYHHPLCGVSTGMPEQIIRSYLANPFLYSGGSFCCGCRGYRPYVELFWEETGQSLEDYFRELQEDYLREYGELPPKTEV